MYIIISTKMCKQHMLLKLRMQSYNILLEMNASEFSGTCLVEKILKTEPKLQNIHHKINISIFAPKFLYPYLYACLSIFIPISPIGTFSDSE